MQTARSHPLRSDSKGIQECTLLTNCMWTAHQTLRNIREEGVTLPNRVKEERDPEVALKQRFISEPSVELHPQSCTLASALESDSVGLEWVPDS